MGEQFAGAAEVGDVVAAKGKRRLLERWAKIGGIGHRSRRAADGNGPIAEDSGGWLVHTILRHEPLRRQIARQDGEMGRLGEPCRVSGRVKCGLSVHNPAPYGARLASSALHANPIAIRFPRNCYAASGGAIVLLNLIYLLAWIAIAPWLCWRAGSQEADPWARGQMARPHPSRASAEPQIGPSSGFMASASAKSICCGKSSLAFASAFPVGGASSPPPPPPASTKRTSTFPICPFSFGPSISPGRSIAPCEPSSRPSSF